MDYTREEVRRAIVVLGTAVGQGQLYESLADRVTPALVKDLVYELFVGDFSPLRSTEEEAEAWNILTEFCRELKFTQFVTFKE